MSIEKKKRASLLQSAFGHGNVDTSGKNIALRCPDCNDSKLEKKKLVVQLETGWFNCWVCGLSGKNISFLFRKHAKKYFSQCQDIFDCEKSGKIKEEEEVLSLGFPEDAKLVLRSKDPDARAIVRYLKGRGMTTQDIYRWRVCFSSRFPFIRKAIFPSHDALGELNYYVSRSIDNSVYKYTNAKIPKSSIVFNEIDIDWSQPVILVEGVFDAVKCPDNTVPVLGSSLPKKSKLYNILSKNRSTVIVAFDSDAETKAHKVCRSLSQSGCNVYKVSVSGGDLGSKTRDAVIESLRGTKKWSDDSMISHKIMSIKSGSTL